MQNIHSDFLPKLSNFLIFSQTLLGNDQRRVFFFRALVELWRNDHTISCGKFTWCKSSILVKRGRDVLSGAQFVLTIKPEFSKSSLSDFRIFVKYNLKMKLFLLAATVHGQKKNTPKPEDQKSPDQTRIFLDQIGEKKFQKLPFYTKQNKKNLRY